ncbi:hypothetical protein AB0D11_20110 [Streptomyces monashensis]|uniref:hypothetical protein n=1 Tax=Streptomyces monashensis TaxID=1678012 RepID=UPI0034078EE8
MNSDVSKEFIGKTAGEFEDATKEATSVHNILQDTRSELKSYKEQLHQAVENGRKKNLTVIPSGDGFIVTMAVHPDRAGKGTDVPDHTVADEDHLRDQVQKILDNAARSDSTATDVLMALVDESKYGFSGAVYKDRDQAGKAVQEADKLAKLARKDSSASSEVSLCRCGPCPNSPGQHSPLRVVTISRYPRYVRAPSPPPIPGGV